MKIDSIGEVIAERELRLDDEATTKLVVRIGKPQPFPDGGGFFCPVEILGRERIRRNYAGGVDAFQAIELGYRIIGIELAVIARDEGVPIRWEADDGGGWGFPFPEQFRE